MIERRARPLARSTESRLAVIRLSARRSAFARLEDLDRRVDVSKDAEYRRVAAIADKIGMRAGQQAKPSSAPVPVSQVIPGLPALNGIRQPREVASRIGGVNVIRIEDEEARLLDAELIDRGDVDNVVVLERRQVLVKTHHAND